MKILTVNYEQYLTAGENQKDNIRELIKQANYCSGIDFENETFWIKMTDEQYFLAKLKALPALRYFKITTIEPNMVLLKKNQNLRNSP